MESRESQDIGNDDTEPPEPPYQILVANEQSTLEIDADRITELVRAIFRDSRYETCSLSLAVVDDPTIHQVNRQYLEHDYPTDVLSFPLEDDGTHLTGELIVSADTAKQNATDYGWPAFNELMLYVAHGTLHLVGYRDKQPQEVLEMRRAEQRYLAAMGIEVPATHMQVVEESS